MSLIPRSILYFLLVCMVSLAACAGTVYTNESHSMEPTLMEGDRISVYPIALSELERGDLVVYANPNNEEEAFVKRLIALPGESVEIKDGKVYIDGTELVEEYNVNPIPTGHTYGPIIIGDDEFFMLGDNRPASQDSRVHGPIPGTLIQGKAFLLQ